jgi:acyl dehydratase
MAFLERMGMAVDIHMLAGLNIPGGRQSYSPRDSLLYALGVGCGIDPSQEGKSAWLHLHDARPLPSMATILGYGGLWVSWCPPGIDRVTILHASQSLALHQPLPPSGTVVREGQITDVVDKGAGKALLIRTMETLRDEPTGDLLASMDSIIYCRGAGGGGGTVPAFPEPARIPDRPPDSVHAVPTSPQQARIYSLSGDESPVHWDQEAAVAAGWDRPILQGLSSYGAACAAMVRLFCANDPSRFHRLDVRFAGPVFPADALELQVWQVQANEWRFRLFNRDRKAIALDNGLFCSVAAEEKE